MKMLFSVNEFKNKIKTNLKPIGLSILIALILIYVVYFILTDIRPDLDPKKMTKFCYDSISHSRQV